MQGNDEMTEISEREDQPEEDFENAGNDNTSNEKRLIKMIITTILFIQTHMGFYDSCLEYLLRFIKLMIQLIKSNYSIESIQKFFEIFPSSIYMARQSIYLERDSFQKYVICTVCHSLTTYEDSWAKSLTTRKITKYSK